MGFRASVRKPLTFLAAAGIVAVGGAFLAWFLNYKSDPTGLEFWGRIYGAVLQLQLVD